VVDKKKESKSTPGPMWTGKSPPQVLGLALVATRALREAYRRAIAGMLALDDYVRGPRRIHSKNITRELGRAAAGVCRKGLTRLAWQKAFTAMVCHADVPTVFTCTRNCVVLRGSGRGVAWASSAGLPE